jgi:tetraacyldisaccharide-1-P 4'-kinase
MTEKDAVKCAALGVDSARHDLWFLAVDAVVDAGLQSLIINLLNQRKSAKNGSKTA